MNAERERLIENIGEIVEALPLAASVIRDVRQRLAKTSLRVLREIWAERAVWKDAVERGLL